MMPASTNGGGMCFAFPDVCLTPAVPSPVPVAYPNVTQGPTINPGTASTRVLIEMKVTATITTMTTVSSGDEAGNAPGGVVSGTFAQGGKYTLGSTKVFAEGKPVAHLCSMTAQNNPAASNIPPGIQVAPSQAKVLVMP